MRKKLTEEEKKDKFTITIDEKISKLLDKYLEDKDISNKSKYVESLIREDMRLRGKDVSIDF